MKQPFIQMREVNKFYPLDKDRFQALKGINLTIEEGEFVAIRGRSGAGTVSYTHLDVYKRQAFHRAKRG